MTTKHKRKKPVKITPALRAAIARDIEGGRLSRPAIADKHGVSIGPVNTISRALRQRRDAAKAPSDLETQTTEPRTISVLDQALARIEGRSVTLSADLYGHLESIANRRKCSVEALTAALLRTALVL